MLSEMNDLFYVKGLRLKLLFVLYFLCPFSFISSKH